MFERQIQTQDYNYKELNKMIQMYTIAMKNNTVIIANIGQINLLLSKKAIKKVDGYEFAYSQIRGN